MNSFLTLNAMHQDKHYYIKKYYICRRNCIIQKLFVMTFTSYARYHWGDKLTLKPSDLLFNKLDFELVPDLIHSVSEHKLPIAIYSLVFVLFFILTLVCHWAIVEFIFSILTNSIILFLFFGVLIFVSEQSVEFEVEKVEPYYSKHEHTISPVSKDGYKKSVSLSCILLLTFTILFFVIRHYSKEYQFDCSTVYVENDAREFHLQDNCDYITGSTEKKQAFEVKDKFSLCVACEEWAEDESSLDGIPSRYR